MSGVMFAVLALALGLCLGAALYWLSLKLRGQSAQVQIDTLLHEAKQERERIAREAELDAKDKLLKVQQEQERELRKQRDELAGTEKRLRQRETNIERKSEQIDKRDRELKKREAAIVQGEQRSQKLLEEAQERVSGATQELEKVAAMSQEEARQKLFEAMHEAARRDAAVQIKRIEEETQSAAQERAARIVAGAVQRLASEFVAEKTVSIVELSSDDMKGRIIGREGRNIRAIEAATGVDVIIDDTPEVVILSGFNPVRREIAKIALERLIADGRIHPARIEEVVEKATQDMDQLIVRAGEQAVFELGLHGVHPELIKMVGKLKWRTVGGQNLWGHSMETAAIAGMMATELGINPMQAKRAGLLHDIGKAVDHEIEGHHANIGAEHARRFGEKPAVVQAIEQNHDNEPKTILGILVQAADVLSKQRPGARKDLLETYIKRLDALERISQSFKGVEKAYAIQAGREVRVMVDYGQVSDDEAFVLCNDIARRIQDELTYPGEVRVTVIREARATEIAR